MKQRGHHVEMIFNTREECIQSLSQVLVDDENRRLRKEGKSKYSAYGTTANCSMFPIAMGIIFGNENKKGWGMFWKFAVKLHPCLNNPDITIITDQDKGSISAIQEFVPNAHHFHCSWHRKGNVLKNCKGGKKIHGGWWYFNQLIKCNTIHEIEQCCDDYLDKIPNHAITHINKLNEDKLVKDMELILFVRR